MMSTSGRLHALSALVRVLARTSGKRALYLAVPAYSLVGIVAFILFAGNGMNASLVTTAALDSFAVRLVLLVAWLMLTLPVSRVLLADPGAFFLRTLPVHRTWLLSIVSLGLALVHVPWCLLWARGSSAFVAAWALVAMLAAQSYVLRRPRSAADGLGAAVSLGAWWSGPSLPALALSLAAFLVGCRSAWLRAPEASATGLHSVVRGTPLLALASALFVSAQRAQRSATVRALFLVLLTCAGATLGLNASHGLAPEQVRGWALTLWSSACLLAAVTLARPLLRAEAALGWVLDGCGTSLGSRAGSALFLMGVLGSVGGLVFGLVLVGALALPLHASIPLLLMLVGSGAGWSITAMAILRLTTRGTPHDSSRALLALLGTFAPTSILLWRYPFGALLLLGALAATLGAWAARRGSERHLP